MTPRAALFAAVAVGLSASASSGATASFPNVPPSQTGSQTGSQTTVRATPKVTKLLVVVEENHSLAQMREGMPYTWGLATTYAYATHYRALTHPSLPNYLAVASGRTFGIADDAGPDEHQLPGHTVFGQALARGRTATVYAEGMPAPCSRVDSGAYAVRHNPWTYFPAEAEGCAAHDVSMAGFAADAAAGTLPRVGLVVPDLDHDAHDGTLDAADAWFESVMAPVFAGPDWQAGRLAVVLTADEDDRTHGNRVLTVVIHPSQRHRVVTAALDHYSLTRLYDEVAGLPLLHNAGSAPSMATAFGLRVPAPR